MGVARQTGSQVQATQGLTGLSSSGKGKSAMGFSREMTRFLLSFLLFIVCECLGLYACMSVYHLCAWKSHRPKEGVVSDPLELEV